MESREGAGKSGPLGVGGSDDMGGLVLRRSKGQERGRNPVKVTHVDSFVLFVSACVSVVALPSDVCNGTYSSRLKSFRPQRPSSFAFHTP